MASSKGRRPSRLSSSAVACTGVNRWTKIRSSESMGMNEGKVAGVFPCRNRKTSRASSSRSIRGETFLFQSLKSPTTETDAAFGAHTAK